MNDATHTHGTDGETYPGGMSGPRYSFDDLHDMLRTGLALLEGGRRAADDQDAERLLDRLDSLTRELRRAQIIALEIRAGVVASDLAFRAEQASRALAASAGGEELAHGWRHVPSEDEARAYLGRAAAACPLDVVLVGGPWAGERTRLGADHALYLATADDGSPGWAVASVAPAPTPPTLPEGWSLRGGYWHHAQDDGRRGLAPWGDAT